MSHKTTLIHGLVCLFAASFTISTLSFAQEAPHPLTNESADHDGDAHWDPAFRTFTFQRVLGLELDGNEAFLAGPFNLDGREPRPAVVRSQPGASTVETLLEPADGGSFESLALTDNVLFAAGSFDLGDGMHNIAAWNRTNESWQALASGLEQPVRFLDLNQGDSLFAAANFFEQGGPWTAQLHLWDGNAWSALGGEFEGYVFDMAVNGQEAYLSMQRNVAQGSIYEIRRWDGEEWSTLAALEGVAYALAADESGNLYAGGRLDAVDGVTAHGVAMWDGGHWSPVGELSRFDSVVALEAEDGLLVAGGQIQTPDGIVHMMMWDGESWSSVDPETNGEIDRIALSNDRVAVAGLFEIAGNEAAYHAAVYDSKMDDWSAMKTSDAGGIFGSVSALAVGEDGELYAGGRFEAAGSAVARNVAVWDGASWSALGEGLPQQVRALQIHEGRLFAGAERDTVAEFSSALSVWDADERAWKAVEPEIGGAVLHRTVALATANGKLYVSGILTEPLDGSTDVLLAWDGSDWSIIGTSAYVGRLAVDEQGAVYAGGYFESISGVAANNIAKWDGSEWTPLGGGLDPEVSALAASNGNVYAGAYGPDLHIFDGDTEEWLVSRVPIQVQPFCSPFLYALAARSDTVYVGGAAGICTTDGTGDDPTQLLARWTPNNGWSVPGSGVQGWGILALALDGDDLYAAGGIDRAGGRSSLSIAHWNAAVHLPEEPPTIADPMLLAQNYPNPASARTTIVFTLDRPTQHVTLALYDMLGRRVAVLADGARAAGEHSVDYDVAALPAGTYFYRLATDSRQELRRMVVIH